MSNQNLLVRKLQANLWARLNEEARGKPNNYLKLGSKTVLKLEDATKYYQELRDQGLVRENDPWIYYEPYRLAGYLSEIINLLEEISPGIRDDDLLYIDYFDPGTFKGRVAIEQETGVPQILEDQITEDPREELLNFVVNNDALTNDDFQKIKAIQDNSYLLGLPKSRQELIEIQEKFINELTDDQVIAHLDLADMIRDKIIAHVDKESFQTVGRSGISGMLFGKGGKLILYTG